MAMPRRHSDWFVGAALCVFFPMLVNLVVLATFLLDSSP